MRGGLARVNCPNCGGYYLSEEYYSDVIANKSLNPTQMATLSYAIRHNQSASGQVPRISTVEAENILKTTELPNANEQIDNLIIYMGLNGSPGEQIELSANDIRAELGCIDAAGSRWVISQALDRKLIEGVSDVLRSTNDFIVIGATLTIDGWDRFHKTQSGGFFSESSSAGSAKTKKKGNFAGISEIPVSHASNLGNYGVLHAEKFRDVDAITPLEILKESSKSLEDETEVNGYKVTNSKTDSNTNTADIPETVGSGSSQNVKKENVNPSVVESLRQLLKGDSAGTSEQTIQDGKDNSDENSDEQSTVDSATQNETGATAKEPIRIERIAEKDLLNRERLIDAVHAFLTQRIDTNPLAIALFGEWGAGKTSFIKLLTKKLSDSTEGKKVHVVIFNAWHHEQVEKPAAALAQAIVEGIVKDLSLFEEAWLAWKLHVRQAQRGNEKENASRWKKTRDDLTDYCVKKLLLIGVFLESWLARASLGAISLLCVGWLIAAFVTHWAYFTTVWSMIITTISSIGILVSGIGIALSNFVEKWVSKNLTQWFKKINLKEVVAKFRMPDYKVHLGIYHEIHCTLKILCDLRFGKDIAAKDESLLLVVDDLDRCSPSMVKAMFDSIRLVADVDRVVTIVAIDERIAYAAVSKYFSEFGSAGRSMQSVARDYLSKVFGLSITLPNAEHVAVGKFVRESLFVGNAVSGGTEKPPEIIADPLSQDEIRAEVRRAAFDRIRESGKTNIIGTMINDQKREKSNDGKDTNDSEFPPQKPVAPPLLANFCVGEPDLFATLALDYGFHNPRQLWRLRQSWQLCKQLNLDENYRLADVQPWLKTLFWCEWCLDRRDDKQNDATMPSNEIPVPDSGAGNDVPTSAIPTREEFANCKQRVKSIILPAVPF